MALTGDEVFGTEIPGFVTDSGELVVTTDDSEATYGVVPGFLTDPDGRLVVTTTTEGAEFEGGFLRLNGALVMADESGTYGPVIPGFTTNDDNALCVVSEATVSWVTGFTRDANDTLGAVAVA